MIEPLLAAENLLGLGLLDHAERTYRQVLAADPQNAIAAVGLSRVALERGDEPGALALAWKALAIDPENATARRMIDRLEEVASFREAAAGAVAPAAAEPAEPAPPAPAAPAAIAPQVVDSGAMKPAAGASAAGSEPFGPPVRPSLAPDARLVGRDVSTVGGTSRPDLPGDSSADHEPLPLGQRVTNGGTVDHAAATEPSESPAASAPAASAPAASAAAAHGEPPPSTGPGDQPGPTPTRPGLLRRLLRRT